MTHCVYYTIVSIVYSVYTIRLSYCIVVTHSLLLYTYIQVNSEGERCPRVVPGRRGHYTETEQQPGTEIHVRVHICIYIMYTSIMCIYLYLLYTCLYYMCRTLHLLANAHLYLHMHAYLYPYSTSGFSTSTRI